MPERRDFRIGLGPALMIAASVVVAGVAVAGGAFLGGYALGNTPAPPPPTELAEKTYTVEDLAAAATECDIDPDAISGNVLSLPAAEYTGNDRACAIYAMDASPKALSVWGIEAKPRPDSGEWTWSNVTLRWTQTEDGRDLTITVE